MLPEKGNLPGTHHWDYICKDLFFYSSVSVKLTVVSIPADT